MPHQPTASGQGDVHVHRGSVSYLQHYAGGLIVIYHLVNDWLEEVFITFGEKDRFVMALERRTSTYLGKGEKAGDTNVLWSSMPSRSGTLRQ